MEPSPDIILQIFTIVRGSPLAVVMTHEWIAASTCEDTHVFHMQNTCLWNIIMVVSQVMLSRITLEPHVDQLVMSTLVLVDSIMMMQLCRHYWEVKNLQQCA